MTKCSILLPSNFDQENDFKKFKKIDTETYNTYSLRTKQLLQLLKDIGAIIIDSDTDIPEWNSFLQGNVENLVPRLLGYVAEGIVVRQCYEDKHSNKKWANLARVIRHNDNAFIKLLQPFYYDPFKENPDDYKAIGTGFAKTKKEYPHLYNALSNRDICWIHKNNDVKQLLSIEGVRFNKNVYAGIQIKVSSKDNGVYITKYFKEKPFYQIYPVVYFDLGNDFNIILLMLYLCSYFL